VLTKIKEQILEHWELLNRLAARRFGDRPLAEEAALYVMNQLLEHDGQRLRSYNGRSSYAAFVASVSWRLLEDFSRKRFGRRRPPLWIRNLGGIWLRLYSMLCLERLDITEAVAVVAQSTGDSPGNDPEEAAWIIRQQVIDCGGHQGLEVALDEEQLVGDDESGSNNGAQVYDVESRERKELFRMLFSTLTDIPETNVEQNLKQLCSLRVELLPEEKLLLKLCYQDGLSVTRAGEMLGFNRHQVHGRLRRLLERLRNEFQQAGLDREILELLK
jgi:RNA polymerase sigma factor (sigma-70 family)